MGVKESKIAFRHILPNIISVILVTLTLDFAGCMLTESSLSYLGFGVNYPRPTWGNMLNAGQQCDRHQKFLVAVAFPRAFPCGDDHLHQHCRRHAARRHGPQVQRRKVRREDYAVT